MALRAPPARAWGTPIENRTLAALDSLAVVELQPVAVFALEEAGDTGVIDARTLYQPAGRDCRTWTMCGMDDTGVPTSSTCCPVCLASQASATRRPNSASGPQPCGLWVTGSR
jgi:hypothetical protein